MRLTFRAYLKNYNEMRKVKSIAFEETYSFSGDIPPHVTVEGWCDIFPLEEIELMQYTGLKDKNGVEIFEGDIVTYIDKRGQKKIGKINYANAKYYIGNFETLGYASERYELEIIGNIYEDLELLEENNK